MFKFFISFLLTFISLFMGGIMVEFRTNNELLEKYVNSQIENIIQIDSLQGEYDELLHQRIKINEEQNIHKIDSLSKVVRSLNNEVTRMQRTSIMNY
jgi:hypothetical protein